MGTKLFRQVADPARFTDPTAFVVRVPRGVRSKVKLLGMLARQLRFPRYFGWNWDALEECLRDLSWLGEPRKIVIVHESLPFGANSDLRATYLAILGDLVAQKLATGHTVEVVVPQE